MNRTVDPGPGRSRARASSPSRGVAAALAAALLAGVGVAWLTRDSDAALPAASVAGVTSTAARPAGDPTTPAPQPGSPGSGSPAGTDGSAGPARPAVHPATQQAGATAAVPDRLTIRRLGIDMRVVPVGVARDGEMALPETPAQVGWYRYGPRPGDDAGSTVLAAHLDMPGYGIGPIATVEELRTGDVITVRSGEVTRRYAVTSVASVRKTTLDLAALFARDGPALLHVVTCGGDFDRERRRYDENVVVTAEPLA
ncbi:class F sortase [Terracoccus sp. 273MFTsu3.1]|uniref:class F sortase n=1 Tax=Terracoccus sp. 273MFTsu3.1 TaxID=1172188 RepID=UPI00036CEF44|nr:class F sortase [Terracoccus sp. 273MFTsu3.1]